MITILYFVVVGILSIVSPALFTGLAGGGFFDNGGEPSSNGGAPSASPAHRGSFAFGRLDRLASWLDLASCLLASAGGSFISAAAADAATVPSTAMLSMGLE